MSGWQFWIDRGGTFTDVVAKAPDGSLKSHKLLSENPGRYADAALQGMRDILGLGSDEALPAATVEAVKMGTTVATNALLERQGEPCLLVTTRGFADALRIGYQNRPRLFDRHIVLPEMLYRRVVEVDERVQADGRVLTPLDEAGARQALETAFADGLRACAVVFMHGYRHDAHEARVAEIAREVGFTQVSASHEVIPLMKLVSRGDTTVADAYLSPILERYVARIAAELEGRRLMFMQSNGGLTDAHRFRGKDAILSGPAGGVVGAVRTADMAGFEKIIGFDMGGTSTDVSHYDGTFERTQDNIVAGVRIRAPMMRIHTVAAGGGSILHFDGARMRVGPDSAGADPGPACYRRDGPLSVTDCNVMLGRVQPAVFPHVFGPGGDQPLDADVVRERFAALAEEIGDGRAPEAVAEGFLRIAVDNMANAIKVISTQRGYDITAYTLCGFGAAAGQHVCAVADALGMDKVLLHPFAGVLSAYGMGLADIRVIRERGVEAEFGAEAMAVLHETLAGLEADARAEITTQGVSEAALERRAHIRYLGTDTALVVPFDPESSIAERFAAAHERQFGFASPDKPLVVEALSVELAGGAEALDEPETALADGQPAPDNHGRMLCDGAWRDVPIFAREAILPGQRLAGPAIVIEPTATTVVDPGWQAEMTARGHLLLSRAVARPARVAVGTSVDPVMLEIFNNLFMSIAEQMGSVLENTAHSVNVKERLDFSCAVFDCEANLVANAPHMPVHLGSMGESVRTVIAKRGESQRPGDVTVLNAPYAGGTHLPDVTVITPVFDAAGGEILFYVASRGHHADIGGITPGSMPAASRVIEEEGVMIENFPLVRDGEFREQAFRDLLASGKWPARNPDQNVADLRAQMAANHKGVSELHRMVDHFGLDVVNAYMGHVQDNAAECVRRELDKLAGGSFAYPLDDGSVVKVAIDVDHAKRCARIDFTGTSAQLDNNYNAPTAVCRAAVLYVFRTLVDDDIPLNEGCLAPLELIIPDGSMLAPHRPAAVVAGNVETSQIITDTLYGALGVLAGSQGTMNNLTFGNARYQYYETVCGGAGAGPDFDGTSAVHTHMTNSRLTDPEVLEWRFPVLLESFTVRPNSGGAGRHRGGDGTVRRLRFLETMTASILSSHRTVPPFGLDGGAPGAVGRNTVERVDGSIEELPHAATSELQPGDVFVIETPGGGGYGQILK
jgi:5-oxoprolinase (ATP-hydrolysing)